MCGIAGYIRPSPEAARPDLDRMVETLSHRGPDGSGVYTADGVGLGHRRLAVLDLTSAGHQPMASADGRLVVTYNGEIYNYLELRAELEAGGAVFRSHTDTEVILAGYRAWGDACVRRFNGMWAFALWDDERRRLFCARDRFGAKPFVYGLGPGRLFVFASEPKAVLAALPEARRPDFTTLKAFLVHGRMMGGTRTFYTGLRQLPAAHTLVVDQAGLTLARYWQYPAIESGADHGSEARRDEAFLALLLDAVRLRNRSDVEVGTTVSGGLDSSVIAAAFRHQFPDLRHRSYSATFRGAGYDETAYLEAVVDAYQLSLTKVPQDGTGVVESLARLVHHLDSPAISPAVVPMHRVMTAARADGIKVLFDGQGADELLGGYDSHFQPRALHGLARAALAAPDPARLRALAQGLMGLSRRDLAPLARYLLPALHGPYRRLLGIDSALTPELRAVASDPDEQPSRLYTDPLAHALHQAHAYAILPGLLHYGDAVSMASSVECRLPFLDYRLVEFCFRLPASDKIGPDGTKAILRRASQGLLIDKVRCRRWKNGFNTPIRDWLLADPQLPALLGEEAVRRHRVFRPEALCGRAGLARLTTLPQTHLLRWVSTLLWLAVCIG